MAKLNKIGKKDRENLLERFLEDPFRDFMRNRLPAIGDLEVSDAVMPKVDMYEKDDKIIVKAEAPGINKDDIKISISDGILNIKGELREEDEVKDEDYYYSERSFGSFSRRLRLPAEVDEDKVKASFGDGVLNIELPKSSKSRPREIKVDIK